MIVPRAPPQIEITSALRANEASERINSPMVVCLQYRVGVGRLFGSRPLRLKSGILLAAFIISALGIAKFRSHEGSILQAIKDLGLHKSNWAMKPNPQVRMISEG